MRCSMALDAGHFRMRILALDQDIGDFAMTTGAVFIWHRISISHRVLGRMGGMTAFAVSHCHAFGVSVMAAEAFGRFFMGGVTFETIHLGMGTGTFRHGFSLIGMAGDTGSFDRCNL